MGLGGMTSGVKPDDCPRKRRGSGGRALRGQQVAPSVLRPANAGPARASSNIMPESAAQAGPLSSARNDAFGSLSPNFDMMWLNSVTTARGGFRRLLWPG